MKAKLKKIPKHFIIIGLLSLIAILTIAVPTLSRLVGGINESMNLTYWDGSVATGYSSGTGTKEDPYIISTGSELAFFAENLKTTTYKNIYFRLSSDIILNNGYFIYDGSIAKYVVNETEYYLKEYTNELYINQEMTSLADINVNIFSSIETFEGHLDGNYFSIYGLYLTSETKENLAMFNNLSGTLENIYIENLLISGGNKAAGIANNATNLNIKNVYTNGYVASNAAKEITENLELDNVNITTTAEGKSFKLSSENDLGYEVISSNLIGHYVVDSEEELLYELSIGDEIIELGEFNVDLGDSNISDIRINTTADATPRNVSLINLKYNVVYKISSSAGLFNEVSNLNVTNVAGDIDVYNSVNASGFISNINGATNINNSYNIGNIYGEITSTGLIGNINADDVKINKTYNAGLLNGKNNFGIVSSINDYTNISISNTFNAIDTEFVGNYDNGAVLANVYNYSTSNFSEIKTMIDNTYSNEFLSTINFSEYLEDSKNEENVWIYNVGTLPELFFIDDINLIDIRIGQDYWNNISYNPDNVYYNSELTVAVTSSSPIYTLDTVEYYIHNSAVALTSEELSEVTWQTYTGGFKLDTENQNIVYVKLTNYAGEIKYINSDIINIDKTNPEGSIIFDDNVWTDYRKDVTEIKLIKNNNITINSTDDNGVESVDYYVSEEILTEKDLNNLNEANWSSYSDTFSITPVGNNVLYAKITDVGGNISYLNSDIITFDGYHMNYLRAGRNDLFTTASVVNITSKSSITANFVYNVPTYSEPEVNHYISFNKAIPYGTIIVVTDNITGQKYDYKTTTSDSTKRDYKLTDFNLIGTVDSYYTESNYDDGTYMKENFTINLNFEEASITENISNLEIWMEVQDDNGVRVRNTVSSSIIPFNIYHNYDAKMYFNASVSETSIKYNADSITTFNINAGINYRMPGAYLIYDTYIEEQDIVMQFEIIDTNNSNLNVGKDKLTNMYIKVGTESYYPNENGVFTVNLEKGIQEINEVFELHAYKSDNFLNEGDYAIKMTAYMSYNDYTNEYISSKNIPLHVSANAAAHNIKFEVEMSNDIVINKDVLEEEVEFNTILSGAADPNIRISLYKKDEYNAVSQTYTLVDLNDYLVSPLSNSNINNVYLAPSNNFSITLDTVSLDKQAYKFVIEAYDGNSLLRQSEKHFVVK